MNAPEPVVHTQTLVPVASPHQHPPRYELPTEIPSQVSSFKPLKSDEERFAEECLKNQLPSKHWQSKRFGQLEITKGARHINPFVSSNNAPTSDQNTNLSNSSSAYPKYPVPANRPETHVGKASTSEYSFDSTAPGDFHISPDMLRNEKSLELETNPKPESKHDQDLARNSKMVRKVNWEEIQPEIEVAIPQTQPNHFPGLVRQVSPPETELRAFSATKKGKALATRGAYFAAKEEFINALMIVAQSNDRDFGNRDYTTSLLAGFTALKESEDFATTPQRREHSRNLKLVLASHETNVIQPNQFDSLSFNKASETYCQFAQTRIEQAIGESKAASSALFHLSRILSTAPELRGEPGILGDNTKRAILLASLTANPANFEAANELGVLFYEEAWYKPAIHWFSHAVKNSGGSQLFWRNLAEAHSRLAETTQLAGERTENTKLAQLAHQEAGTAPKLESSETPLAGWVSQEQFRRNSAISEPSFNQQVPVSTAPIQVVSPTVSQKRTLPKRIKDWFQ